LTKGLARRKNGITNFRDDWNKKFVPESRRAHKHKGITALKGVGTGEGG